MSMLHKMMATPTPVIFCLSGIAALFFHCPMLHPVCSDLENTWQASETILITQHIQKSSFIALAQMAASDNILQWSLKKMQKHPPWAMKIVAVQCTLKNATQQVQHHEHVWLLLLTSFPLPHTNGCVGQFTKWWPLFKVARVALTHILGDTLHERVCWGMFSFAKASICSNAAKIN